MDRNIEKYNLEIRKHFDLVHEIRIPEKSYVESRTDPSLIPTMSKKMPLMHLNKEKIMMNIHDFFFLPALFLFCDFFAKKSADPTWVNK